MAFAFAWQVLSISLDAAGAIRGYGQFLRIPAKYLHPIESSHGRRVTLVDLRGSMPKYIIERNIPGAGGLDRQQLAAITQTSCNVLKGMGPQIQWIESYVTDDKIYCVYIAPDEATIREHARLGQFPADSVQAVRSVIDPTYT
jgi:Protein of unknown function (DUF4242)